MDLVYEWGYNVNNRGGDKPHLNSRKEKVMKQIDEKLYAELVAAKVQNDRMKAINKRSYERRNAYIKLMVAKAEKQGIKVSEAEVDAYLKK